MAVLRATKGRFLFAPNVGVHKSQYQREARREVPSCSNNFLASESESQWGKRDSIILGKLKVLKKSHEDGWSLKSHCMASPTKYTVLPLMLI
jgi:hypothetical protein